MSVDTAATTQTEESHEELRPQDVQRQQSVGVAGYPEEIGHDEGSLGYVTHPEQGAAEEPETSAQQGLPDLEPAAGEGTAVEPNDMLAARRNPQDCQVAICNALNMKYSKQA